MPDCALAQSRLVPLRKLSNQATRSLRSPHMAELYSVLNLI